MTLPLEAKLRAGLGELGLALDELQISRLLNYQALLQKWNRVYNLTAVRDPAEMLTHHLFDSLSVISALQCQLARVRQGGLVKLLDVGSGAGLPGVVVAICCPDVRVDCVDAVAKKAAFVQQVAATLKLPNLRGLHARVEQLSERYQVVSARAFATLKDFTACSQGVLTEAGLWLAMKGKYPTDEIAALAPDVALLQVQTLTVPGLAAERCLVWMKRARF